MTEHEQKIAEIEIHGFALIDRVLSVDEVAEMKETLIRCERSHCWSTFSRSRSCSAA